MSLLHIVIFCIFSLAIAWLFPRKWRGELLLGGSLLSVYWAQPSTPDRYLDFWLPTLAVWLVIFVWVVTSADRKFDWRTTLTSLSVIIGLPLAISLARYSDALCCLTPGRPPEILTVLIVVAILALVTCLPIFLPAPRFWSWLTILLILVLFVFLKSPPLTRLASGWIRAATGQSIELASASDIPWLGFSFLAFRLLHMLRDYQGGKLPANQLGETMTFGLFFPAYTAGPIDRLQRFANDLRQATDPLDRATGLLQGGRRIVLGLFKKFVLADGLALIALSPQNATQVESTFWMWLMLYAYALRLYFDFAGYTDIAIGLGNLMGFKLPENFNRPYLQSNLTAFWNSWHITLAQWFRAYYFNPVTRWLRSSSSPISPWIIILVSQFSTMLLIGLWHGLTWNFFLWGAWHGLGLFIHNRWLDWTRPYWNTHPTGQRWAWLSNLTNWALTFNFVSLGWVWFLIPNPQVAGQVMLKLFGF